MLPQAKQASARTPARPADDLVPEAGPSTRGGWRAARVGAIAAVGPAVLVTAPISRSIRPGLLLGALVVAWAFIAHAVWRSRGASRRWTGIVIGTGLVLVGEVARTVFASSGN